MRRPAEPDEMDEDDSDGPLDGMMELQGTIQFIGVRLECLKLAVAAKDYGDARDPVTIAKEFSGFVIGDDAE